MKALIAIAFTVDLEGLGIDSRAALDEHIAANMEFYCEAINDAPWLAITGRPTI